MADPTTSNVLLAVPLRGADPGTWDVPVNSDFTAIDGYFGGVQTISLVSTNITLTAPSGTVAVSAGPNQAQNAVLKFTGALSANVQVTLPLPGYYIIDNQTTGNFVTTFKAVGSGTIIAVDQGDTMHIYNDGTNVRYVNLGRIGGIEIWAGYTALPAWCTACSILPYILCDGSIYNIASFPSLGSKLGSKFGGNGISTFAVPDLRGRMALPYDGTGTRITTAGSGINGQTIGAAADNQSVTLDVTRVPSLSVTASGSASVSFGRNVPSTAGTWGTGFTTDTTTGNALPIAPAEDITNINSASGTASVTGTTSGGGGSHTNVQPSQVTGIAVIRAG